MATGPQTRLTRDVVWLNWIPWVVVGRRGLEPRTSAVFRLQRCAFKSGAQLAGAALSGLAADRATTGVEGRLQAAQHAAHEFSSVSRG